MVVSSVGHGKKNACADEGHIIKLPDCNLVHRIVKCKRTAVSGSTVMWITLFTVGKIIQAYIYRSSNLRREISFFKITNLIFW
jgi:hypothetical protein